MFLTYHSDSFEGKDGRPKEKRVVFSSADFRQVDGVPDILHKVKKEKINFTLYKKINNITQGFAVIPHLIISYLQLRSF